LALTGGTGQHQGHEPTNRYAQDVEYNQVDADFLRSLGITKIDSPHGFDLVESQSTFAYTPGAEADVSAIVLDKNPPLLLTNELEPYPLQEGGHATTINGLNVSIQNYTSDKTFVHIPSPNDVELEDTAFQNQWLYGYFVAELPADDQGVALRGGGLENHPHGQYGPHGDYADNDDEYGPEGGYGEIQQDGHELYEPQPGQYGDDEEGQDEYGGGMLHHGEEMPYHAGVMMLPAAMTPHAGTLQHGEPYGQPPYGGQYGSSSQYGGHSPPQHPGYGSSQGGGYGSSRHFGGQY
jgi:hypothetical protein